MVMVEKVFLSIYDEDCSQTTGELIPHRGRGEWDDKKQERNKIRPKF